MEKNNEWWQFSGLERSSMLITMLHESFGSEDADNLHPAIYNTKCKELLEKAGEALADLYQAIGEWSEEDEQK